MSDARTRVLQRLGAPESAVEEFFVRAGGPGGQNVNKVATSLRLRLDLKRCASLDTDFRNRLRTLAGRRMSSEDVLSITAQRFRTQERNRTDAWDRVEALVEAASVAPRPRRATRPTRAAREKRLREKNRQGERKRLRSQVRDPDA